MTSTTAGREDYRPEPFPTFDQMAQREAIHLEEINKGTADEIAYVVARGFAALTYAVLALRETADSTGTDLNNVLSDLSEHVSDTGPDLTSLAENVADISDALASACARQDRRSFRLFGRRAES